MKVLHFSKFFPPYSGGIEQVAFDLVSGCRDFGLDVQVICSNDSVSSISESFCDIPVYRSGTLMNIFSTPISLTLPWQFLRRAKRSNIIHLHHPHPISSFCVFLFYPFLRNKKIVVHWHSDIVKQKKLMFFFRPLQNFMLSVCDKILVTSTDYMVNSRDLDKYRNKCESLPIGIDGLESLVNQKLVAEIKNKFKNKFIIFSLGRHIYYKGFEYLIRSAVGLTDDCLILIGGQGPLTDSYRQIILENKLENKVLLLGKIKQEDLSSYYAACDVFCLPSIEKSEAFGVVQIEAMSLGKPVISTDIPGSGVSWVNKHNESGLIVKVKSSEALSDSILNLKLNPNLLKELGLGAKNRFDKHFTKAHMIKKCLLIYKRLFS